jgi:hypothetical protein
VVAKRAPAIAKLYAHHHQAQGSKLITPAGVGSAGGRKNDHAATVNMIHTGERAGSVLGHVDIQANVIAVHALYDLGTPLHILNGWKIGE